MSSYGGGSLSNAITSQRSYGSTKNQTFVLAVIDSNVITHQLKPADTLQGLAIKYGITVEKLKRLNKLWSNESIHTKDTLLIPCPNLTEESDQVKSATCSVTTDYEIIELDSKNKKKKTNKNKPEPLEDDELHSSLKENEGDSSNTNKSETLQSFDRMVNKIDKNDDDLGSDSFKTFTEMLTKIDSQIKIHKNKTHSFPDSNVPVVGYDSYQNIEGGGHTSPVKQHPFLEQGI